jgi:hypothetical protein
MTVYELLVELKKLEEAGYGDTTICVEADHGQQTTNACSVTLENYSEDDECCVHEDDLPEYEGYDLTKMVVIYG